MLVSHSKKFVFIRVPKTASTSLCEVLRPYAEEPDKYRYQGFTRKADLQDLAHLRFDQWSTEIQDALDDGYKTLAVVRDPVTRFQSACAEFLRQHGDWFAKFNMPLEQFLLLMLTPASVKHDWRFIHFCPQYLFMIPDVVVSNEPKEVSVRKYMTQAERRILWVKMENLEKEWPKIRQHLGLTGSVELPFIRSKSSNPMEGLSEEMLSHIDYLYRIDFSLFGYDIPVLRRVQHETHHQRIEFIHRHRYSVMKPYQEDLIPWDDSKDIRYRWDRWALLDQETKYLT